MVHSLLESTYLRVLVVSSPVAGLEEASSDSKGVADGPSLDKGVVDIYTSELYMLQMIQHSYTRSFTLFLALR